MADPLSVATGIISLITLAVKLVAGAAGLIDKTVAAHREASNELQRLQQDLERLGEQMDEIYCKLQFLVASTKDRAFKNLLQDDYGKDSVQRLCNALDETFAALTRLTDRAEVEKTSLQSIAMPTNMNSLKYMQAVLKHSLSPSKVADLVNGLRGMQSEIRACLEKLERSFRHVNDLYSFANNRLVRVATSTSCVSTSTMLPARIKLADWLKRRQGIWLLSRRGRSTRVRSTKRTDSVVVPDFDFQPNDFLDTDYLNEMIQMPHEVLRNASTAQLNPPQEISKGIVVRAIEPSEWDIDGGVQVTIRIHDEDPRSIPYYPRFGYKWTFQPSRTSVDTMVCHIPPVSLPGSVDVTLWREDNETTIRPVLSSRYEFKYKNRSARKVLQLGLKTIFDRVCDYRYHGSQIASRTRKQPRPAAELEETDQISIAILEFYGRDTNESAASGSKLHDLEPHNSQSPLAREAKAHVSDTVLEALNSFMWTNEHDLLAHHTGHGQNFLHICVIGNYEKLLRFFLDHGCGDPEKLARRDDYGRTVRELARVMERKEINLLLSSTRTEPPQDPKDSYEQIKITMELAQRWLELRQTRSEAQEVIWDLQSSGEWRKFNEPGFERDNDRVKVLMGYMAGKTDNTRTWPPEITRRPSQIGGQRYKSPEPSRESSEQQQPLSPTSLISPRATPGGILKKVQGALKRASSTVAGSLNKTAPHVYSPMEYSDDDEDDSSISSAPSLVQTAPDDDGILSPKLPLPPVMQADNNPEATFLPRSHTNLHAFTLASLAFPPMPHPLLSALPYFPRSSNIPSKLPLLPTFRAHLAKTRILDRLEAQNLTAAENESIEPFASKSPRNRPEGDEEPPLDGETRKIANEPGWSTGLDKWTKRAAFTQRVREWRVVGMELQDQVPEPATSYRTQLKVSEGTRALAGLVHPRPSALMDYLEPEIIAPPLPIVRI